MRVFLHVGFVKDSRLKFRKHPFSVSFKHVYVDLLHLNSLIVQSCNCCLISSLVLKVLAATQFLELEAMLEYQVLFEILHSLQAFSTLLQIDSLCDLAPLIFFQLCPFQTSKHLLYLTQHFQAANLSFSSSDQHSRTNANQTFKNAYCYFFLMSCASAGTTCQTQKLHYFDQSFLSLKLQAELKGLVPNYSFEMALYFRMGRQVMKLQERRTFFPKNHRLAFQATQLSSQLGI